MPETLSAWKVLNAICAASPSSDLTHYEVAVMLYLAKCADSGGVNIHPKMHTIAQVLKISPRTAQYAMAGLRRKGYIRVVWESPGYVPVYDFVLEKLMLADEVQNPRKKPKLRKPPTLEPFPPQEPMPQLPDLLITAKMRTLKRRIESYVSLKVVNPKEAELWRPSSDEMKTLIDLYEHLCEISHPDAQQWEHAARYAHQELSAVF